MSENKIITELPVHKLGANKGKVDKQAMVGAELDVLYKGEIYKIKIQRLYKNKFNNWTFDVFYNEKIISYSADTFISNKFGGKLFGFSTTEFKYNIGEVVYTHNGSFILTDRKREIIDRDYRKDYQKYYKYTCNKCGWTEGWMIESHLNKKIGCPVCANKIAVLGINTIWDTDRWMCDLGVSEEDAKSHTRGSDKKIEVACPDCGKKKVMKVGTIYNSKSISCTCGDGFSYPAKFMTNVLMQLGVKFENEYSPNYIKPKRSDFYLPDYNLVIETDGGMGHQGGLVHHKSDKTIEEHIEVDKWKDQQHKLNGVETIRIDCFESDMEYIKNNILNSKLNEIFDLGKVNWIKCEEFALKNIVKEICEYWKNKEEWESTYTIAKNNKWGIIGHNTISRYLKKGSNLEWCEYDSKKETKKASSKAGKKNIKWDIHVYKYEDLMCIFEGYSDLERRSLEVLGEKITVIMGRLAVKKDTLCKGYRIVAIRR